MGADKLSSQFTSADPLFTTYTLTRSCSQSLASPPRRMTQQREHAVSSGVHCLRRVLLNCLRRCLMPTACFMTLLAHKHDKPIEVVVVVMVCPRCSCAR